MQSFLDSDKSAKQFIESRLIENEAEDLLSQLEKVYHKYFPNSYFGGSFSNSLSSSLSWRTALGKDKSEFHGGYIENDPVNQLFFIRGFEKDGSYENLSFERSIGNISVPSKSPYMAFDRVKLPFRKATGDANKILRAWEDYVRKTYDLVKANKDEIKVPFDINKKL